MFDAKIYSQRRQQLKDQLGSGLLLFLGNDESPMNYPGNPFHFRQDSSFLYFFGLNSPDLAGIVDVEEGTDILFGDDVSVDDIIWMGEHPLFKDRAQAVGVSDVRLSAELKDTVKAAIQAGRKIHFLPPYRAKTVMKLGDLLGLRTGQVRDYISESLIKAVVEQRSVKISEEIAEIEAALAVAYKMHTTAMRMTKPGIMESEIAAVVEGTALSKGGYISFPVILTINGQILHNHFHGNRLEEGRLLVNDSGAETAMGYASDITRTFPVSGKFSEKQKDIYNLVLLAQTTAIEAIGPGIKNKEIHLKAVTAIAAGLKDLGLMQGDVEDAVKAGAHALFMPHGLGHMMGLDVHDMENLGENFVGYDKSIQRSDQFGLAYLRLARELQPGYVLTVEPGIYFIPALIEKWAKEEKYNEFIDYKRVNNYLDFGGIRIEDDVLVTESGSQVLGKPIPKTVEELEEIVGSG
ncbi:MAG: M24 family metallopeptidase [Candidatus Aminicenantes bacterium]|nr:M24 family metallopeptidase [Candidatus Aminicenantes bacterium]